MKNKIAVIVGLSLSFSTIIFLLLYNSKYFVKLNGAKEMTIGIGKEYVELGAKNLFNKILKPIGNVDTSKVGFYEIKYCHIGNCVVRKIDVIDDEKPIITLKGDSEINIVLNSQYVEVGYTASDNCDGNLTDKVEIINNLDTTKVGIYEVEYKVTDNSGNIGKVKRKVNVNEFGPMSMSIKDFSLEGYFTNTILKETSSDDNYLNETIFYGDSITANFAYYQNISYNNVWAMSNLTPVNAHTWDVMFYKYGRKVNIIEGFKLYKPKRVIITLGANAIAIMDRDYFISQYEDLIIKLKEASPETQIIVQSVTPVDSRWDSMSNTLNNNKINNINYLLVSMCERLGIKFLNTAEVLKNENGTAIEGYFYAKDGIHLYPVANEIVMNYVKTHRWE